MENFVYENYRQDLYYTGTDLVGIIRFGSICLWIQRFVYPVIPHQNMGISSSELAGNSGISADVIDFCGCFEKLAENSDEGQERRNKSWSAMDNNGNRHVSLAEADSWIKQTLIKQYPEKGERLWKAFRRSYIRSFKDAADAGRDRAVQGMVNATEDDFVERGEFRLFCAYLCLYALMYDAFKFLDGSYTREVPETVFSSLEATAESNKDNKISHEEWMSGYARFAGSPFFILNECASNPEAAASAWAMMDADGKGAVLLVEFCEWIKAWEIQTNSLMGRFLDAGARDASGDRVE